MQPTPWPRPPAVAPCRRLCASDKPAAQLRWAAVRQRLRLQQCGRSTSTIWDANLIRFVFSASPISPPFHISQSVGQPRPTEERFELRSRCHLARKEGLCWRNLLKPQILEDCLRVKIPVFDLTFTVPLAGKPRAQYGANFQRGRRLTQKLALNHPPVPPDSLPLDDH